MEVNDKGLIDIQKMRNQATPSVKVADFFYDLFANSPFKDRTLANVLISKLDVVGPHLAQHKGDFDMTHHYLDQVDEGRLLQENKVSQFNLEKQKQVVTNEEMMRDYSILESLYDI